MPDAHGNFKGQGWSRQKAAAWDRVFGVSGEAEPPKTHTATDALDTDSVGGRMHAPNCKENSHG